MRSVRREKRRLLEEEIEKKEESLDCPELPPELWFVLLHFCQAPNIYSMMLVSRLFNSLAQDLSLWKFKARPYLAYLKSVGAVQLRYLNSNDYRDYARICLSKENIKEHLIERLFLSKSLIPKTILKKKRIDAISQYLMEDKARDLISATSISSSIEFLKKNRSFLFFGQTQDLSFKIKQPVHREHFHSILTLIPLMIRANAIESYKEILNIFFKAVICFLKDKNHPQIKKQLFSPYSINFTDLVDIIFKTKNKYFIFLFIQTTFQNTTRPSYLEQLIIETLFKRCNKDGYLNLFMNVFRRVREIPKAVIVRSLSDIVEKGNFIKEIQKMDRYFSLSCFLLKIFHDGIDRDLWFKKVIFNPNNKNFSLRFIYFVLNLPDEKIKPNQYKNLFRAMVIECNHYNCLDLLEKAREMTDPNHLLKLSKIVDKAYWMKEIDPHLQKLPDIRPSFRIK